MKDNGLSLVCFFPKKKVTYLGGQVGDQAWKFGRHWVKPDRIGDPTGRNVEPCKVKKTYAEWWIFFQRTMCVSLTSQGQSCSSQWCQSFFSIVRPDFSPLSLSWLLKLRTNGRNNFQHCWPAMLGVVASVLAVKCKRMQQLPTILLPTVHRGKDTTHTTL